MRPSLLSITLARRFSLALAIAVLVTVLFSAADSWGAPPETHETIDQPGKELLDYTARRAHERGYVAPAELGEGDYKRPVFANSRLIIWFAAQTHLWFAAFVLAVPIFVVIMEAIGMAVKDERYDRMAREFLRMSLTAYSFTLVTGAFFAAMLFILYPGLMKYLSSVMGKTFPFYFLFFLFENAALYTYYFGWERMGRGLKKRLHLALGVLLNVAGTLIMMVANAWTTFMMTPGGVDRVGLFKGSLWSAINNPLWHPMNLHRLVANVAYGGSIVAAYAAYRFLSARTDEERATYDWMGYAASYVAVLALLPLPFAGYWLTSEIYNYSQQMGMTLMGGLFGWIFIIQAVVIGALFISINYYLWCGLERSPAGREYAGYVKYLGFVILVCFLVWFTPHTMSLSGAEAAALGGQYHPLLGPLGLMPAKNTAINILIIATFLSFLLYRRSRKRPAQALLSRVNAIHAAIIVAASINIIFLGIYYGYFTDNVHKVASSVPQVLSTLTVLVSCGLVEWRATRGLGDEPGFEWGRLGAQSQYALIMLAVSFTWLMGLMGFVRSAIRQHWHVYSVVRDNSIDAYTPTINRAVEVVSVGTIIFLGAVIFIFRLGSPRDKA
jgi:cytochrome bd-type quinol oxidase subunit 1